MAVVHHLLRRRGGHFGGHQLPWSNLFLLWNVLLRTCRVGLKVRTKLGADTCHNSATAELSGPRSQLDWFLRAVKQFFESEFNQNADLWPRASANHE